MSPNGVTYVVSCHDVAVYIHFALWTIKSSNVNLANKFFACRALLGGVIFVDTNDDISERSGLLKQIG